jgi:HSP20 family molecular chaperone IbpA
MKLSIYSLVVFYVAQALGLSIESKPVQEVEDQGDSVSPFISSFWDDFPADADYLIHSLSTMFGDMVQRHNQLFSGFRSNKGDTLASLPTHPFLRGLSAVSPSLTPVQFSIVDDDEKFQLSLRLPTGMTHEDVHVQVQDGGTRLLITGKTQSSSDNGANDNGKTPSFHTFASTSFTQTYSLDPSVEVDRLLATVKDGMFILSAPKDKRKLNDASHVIPVQGLNAMARSFVTPDRPIFTSRGLFSITTLQDQQRFRQHRTAQLLCRSVTQNCQMLRLLPMNGKTCTDQACSEDYTLRNPLLESSCIVTVLLV